MVNSITPSRSATPPKLKPSHKITDNTAVLSATRGEKGKMKTYYVNTISEAKKAIKAIMQLRKLAPFPYDLHIEIIDAHTNDLYFDYEHNHIHYLDGDIAEEIIKL